MYILLCWMLANFIREQVFGKREA